MQLFIRFFHRLPPFQEGGAIHLGHLVAKKIKFRPFIFVLLVVTGSCQKPTDKTSQHTTPPNIIWIVAEDISPALGCYGDPLANTPNIDRLAAEGIRYTNAYATAPICAPARSCLISGRYATTLGTQHLRCEIPFPDQLKTLPEHLAEAGYYTSNRNKTDYNFDPQGLWQHWSGSYAPWRQREDERPFFSFINVGPSHEGSVNREERYLEHVKDVPEDRLMDPAKVTVPPYYPETPETREVWARYYDVLSVMDGNVGRIIDSLEDDGLLDETIIFFFGDHGFGMPRYKRWLYKTGLNVPLVVRVPQKFRYLIPNREATVTDQLVSFVDFAPTTLHLAGKDIPSTMPGQPFLGANTPTPRTHVFAARDRADDMMEMSRSVVNDRYIYIRHYMPHLPYIQSGFIYSDVKDGFRALRHAHEQGLTNTEQEKLWQTKPVEELYDLQEDPQELNNLANSEGHQSIKSELRAQLHQWMINSRDLGLLPEAEYMIRSGDSTPYEMGLDPTAFPVETILEAAEMVGMAEAPVLIEKTKAPQSGVRYWAAIALMQLDEHQDAVRQALTRLLDDPSPSVQIQAAEAICRKGATDKALEVLGKWAQDDRPWLALQAARSIQLVGDEARPLVPTMYSVLEKNLGDGSNHRKYKDFNYSAFTSWALEWALQELGEEVEVN